MKYKIMYGHTGYEPEVVGEVMYLQDAFAMVDGLWFEEARDVIANDIESWKEVNEDEPDFATLVDIRKRAFEDTKDVYWVEENNG